MSEENVVGIRVSKPLVDHIIELNHWSPSMPANYAVDSALRDYIAILEAKEAKKE